VRQLHQQSVRQLHSRVRQLHNRKLRMSRASLPTIAVKITATITATITVTVTRTVTPPARVRHSTDRPRETRTGRPTLASRVTGP
jgi:hypothetical protein